MTKFRKGFTFVETLVVLVISALLLSLSLLLTRNLTLTHFRDTFFWKKVQNQFELSETLARHQHSSVAVEFYSRGPIVFRSTNSKIKSRTLTPPRNLKIIYTNTIMIGNDGHIDPGKVTWLLNNHTLLNQKFQLGWGMYTFDHKET